MSETGRRKPNKQPQETACISFDEYTGKLVREWRRKGINVSEMVRFSMRQTWPIVLKPADRIKSIKQALAFKASKFEEYRLQFEQEASKLNAKVKKLKEAMKEEKKVKLRR